MKFQIQWMNTIGIHQNLSGNNLSFKGNILLENWMLVDNACADNDVMSEANLKAKAAKMEMAWRSQLLPQVSLRKPRHELNVVLHENDIDNIALSYFEDRAHSIEG